MGSYSAVLPEVFADSIEGPPDYIRALVYSLLVPNRKDVDNGSSFAVTVDGREGNWRIWLSQCSKEYVESLPSFFQDQGASGAVGP